MKQRKQEKNWSQLHQPSKKILSIHPPRKTFFYFNNSQVILHCKNDPAWVFYDE